jgi:DNA-binding transcriptional regulator GbsR (MarR family)
MSALPDTVVPFALPKRPKVKQKEAPPDQRAIAVLPIRAGKDERLHGGTLRCLIVLCSYCNRAGITWVGQDKLAKDLGISRQAVSKQMKLLMQTGYVEVVKKGFRGERTNTLRVIFDPSIKTEDAVAITSAQEDTRPPYMKHEQEEQANQPDPAGQARIAKLISQALRQPTKKEPTMPSTGETVTTRKMKEEIKAAQAKRSKRTHTQPPEVANEKASHTQPADTSIRNLEASLSQPPEVATNTEQRIFKESFKELSVLGNFEIEKIKAAGLTERQIADSLDTLLPIYQAEGLTPSSQLLADSILQMHRDTA